MVNRIRDLRGRVRQYGVAATGKHILRVLIRRGHQYYCEIVFVVPGFSGHTFSDPCIKPMTTERIAQALREGDLHEKDARLLSDLLDGGHVGICSMSNGTVTGYAWIQSDGDYRFGLGWHMTLPARCAVARNLFVFPRFRGRRFGRKLNEARLALIAKHRVPVVFIAPENKYAIRNWVQLGFQRVAEVRQWRWFGRSWHMRVVRLTRLSYAEPIIRALEGARHP